MSDNDGDDYDTLKAVFDNDFRPLWKSAKTKHASALAANKIKFGDDLGPQLDKWSALCSALSNTGKTRLKRVKMTFEETHETDPKKRKATRAMLIANYKDNAARYQRDLKSMVDSCNAIIKAAQGYKTKLQGLGNPAERELTAVLNEIIENVEGELRTTREAQSKLKDRLANPRRFDYLG